MSQKSPAILDEPVKMNIFYHYTSFECIKNILWTGVIYPTVPHPLGERVGNVDVR